ncbi:MAG: OmpA family protein [Xanthomonadales bacterium]|nr:OmpA family protein [Xanthomonadales bacterium]
MAEAVFPVIGPAIRRAITEALRELVLNLNRLLESAFTPRGLRWRWQAWRSGVPYAQVALRELLRFRVDHLFLVQNGSGLVLASARQLDLDSDRDTDAVAAMLTAIRDFARDAGLAPGDAELSEVTLGEHLLRLYAGPQAYLAAAITGVPGEELDGTLTELLETAHLQHDPQLQAGEPTENLQLLLQQWLDSSGQAQAELETAQPKRARRPWLGIMAVSVVLLLLAGWLGERAWTGWQRSTLDQLLQQEPGYEVRVERAGWRELRVSGLRDPAARSPDELLAEHPLDVPIDWQTSGYLALDDHLQLQRLRVALAAPASVTLGLESGRLRMSGEAPAEWRQSTSILLRAWPGLRGLVDEVRYIEPVPPPLVPARWEVHFEPGQTVNPVGSAAFDAVAAAWQRSPGSRVMVRAQTDATGTAAQNATLGEQRAQWAVAELIRRGVPLSAIVTSSVQATELAGEDAKLRRVVLQLEATTRE